MSVRIINSWPDDHGPCERGHSDIEFEMAPGPHGGCVEVFICQKCERQKVSLVFGNRPRVESLGRLIFGRVESITPVAKR